MPNLDTKINEFINEKLFTEIRSIQFQDLVSVFGINHLQAKGYMYEYYKTTTDVKYNCIIICVLKNDSIKIVHDISSVDSFKYDVVDCFIYAFNPMKEYIPISSISNYSKSLTIKNIAEVEGEVLTSSQKVGNEDSKPIRSRTSEDKTTKGTSKLFPRSKTVASDGKSESKAEKIKKEEPKKTGSSLRSTEILAKMKRAREEKEEERQRELKKRKEEANKKIMNDPERKEQMQELQGIFDDDDDLEYESEKEKNQEKENIPEHETIKKEINQPISEELEALLDTTAEESLLGINTVKQEQPNNDIPEDLTSSFVDEDGYIVTKRNTPVSTPKTSTSNPKPKTTNTREQSPLKPRTVGSKKQSTLEGFFKKSSKK